MNETAKAASCACCASPTLIFPCSGGSDVGEIADRSARRLTQQGTGRIYCLAGIGGRVSGILASARAAESILAIDGCPLDCAKRTLEEASITQFHHLRLSDLDLEKGSSPATDERIHKAAAAARRLLLQRSTKATERR